MKIQIASDLHLELRKDWMPNSEEFRSVPDRDVLVLAGDIGTYMNAMAFIKKELAVSPVIYVPGNHEYYTWQMREDVDAGWRRTAKRLGDLHYLVAEGVTINGVRFWGAPWFSDLFGERSPGFVELVRQLIHDFDGKNNNFGRWTVHRHLDEHARQTALLRAQAGSVDVVITHWPPTRQAIAPRFQGDRLNGYFVNDREDLVEEIGAPLWISGHVHDPHECRVGTTRSIGNPTGYPGGKKEREGYRPDRVVEVHRRVS